MNPIIYNEFKNLLDKLNQEKDDIENQISDNTLQIIEAKSYAKEILDREEEDFKVFSPRKIEDIYKDELQKSNVKQSDYENRNRALIDRREQIDSVLLVLENVWDEINRELKEAESSDIQQEENDTVESETVEVEGSVDENKIDESSIDNIDGKEDDLQSVTESDLCDANVDKVVEDVFSKSTEKTLKDTVNKLNNLSRKIDMSINFIRQDPMRAKVELETINKNIKIVMDNLCDVVDK